MHLEIAKFSLWFSLLLMTGDEKTCVIDKAHVELYGRELYFVFPMYFSTSIYLELLP